MLSPKTVISSIEINPGNEDAAHDLNTLISSTSFIDKFGLMILLACKPLNLLLRSLRVLSLSSASFISFLSVVLIISSSLASIASLRSCFCSSKESSSLFTLVGSLLLALLSASISSRV